MPARSNRLSRLVSPPPYPMLYAVHRFPAGRAWILLLSASINCFLQAARPSLQIPCYLRNLFNGLMSMIWSSLSGIWVVLSSAYSVIYFLQCNLIPIIANILVFLLPLWLLTRKKVRKKSDDDIYTSFLSFLMLAGKIENLNAVSRPRKHHIRNIQGINGLHIIYDMEHRETAYSISIL